MKKTALIVLAAVMLLLCTGCCFSHDWMEATCNAPKTCSKCEKTEGQPLNHQWRDPTCTDPRLCITCGATEGEPIGHDFGKEKIQNPDYINATATFVQSCANCAEQIQRSGELEKLHDGDVFLMNAQEFSDRFTAMMTKTQELLGEDQYISFVDEDQKTGNLKLYMAKKTTNGKMQIVGEFEMRYYCRWEPLQPEEKLLPGVLWKISGTVTGKNPRTLAMVSLVRTVDPTRDEDMKAIKTLSDWRETPLVNQKTNTYCVHFGDFVVEIQPKSGNTYGLSFEIR